MTYRSKSVVESKVKDLSDLVSSLIASISQTEVTGEELNLNRHPLPAKYIDKVTYCKIDPSEVRLSVDYLSAFLRELKREFGK